MSTKLQSLWGHLVIAAMSIILFFGAVEVTLRLTGYRGHAANRGTLKLLFMMGSPLRPVDPTTSGFYERDRLLFWRLKPDISESVNEKGYRGPLRKYDKAPGVMRIIVLGDSCAYGIGVKDSATYARLLEAKLNALRPGSAEVINAGVPGYTSLQGLRYLESELVRYHPDIVLVGFGFNDLCYATPKRDKDIDIAAVPPWVVVIDNKLRNFKFYMLFKSTITGVRSNLWRPPHHAGTRALPQPNISLDDIQDLDLLVSAQAKTFEGRPTMRVPPDDFADNISSIAALGKRSGFSTVLMTLPSVNGCFGYGPFLRLFAKKYNVELIDLIRQFKSRQAATEAYFIDNNHYNERGHRLVAEIIYEQLNASSSPVAN